MTTRKIPERPHWRDRCRALEAFLANSGFEVTYAKSDARVVPSCPEPCVKQPKLSFLRRAWARIYWLAGV